MKRNGKSVDNQGLPEASPIREPDKASLKPRPQETAG